MTCARAINCGVFIVYVIAVLAGASASSIPSDYAEVHVIPHSHCDPGWKATYPQYMDTVNRILSSVVTAVEADGERRFVWSEIAFFRPWYASQPQHVRDQVKKLVASGRFEFVGGGYVQHDEAVASSDSIITSLAEGWSFLAAEFGVEPKIGWQIDPFGHGTFTQELASRLGWKAVVLNRIHHWTKRGMRAEGTLQFNWGSPFNVQDLVLAHVLYEHYNSPPGLDFERDGPATDDNLAQLAENFVYAVREQLGAYPTRVLMVPFGDDFRHVDADMTLSSMERIIRYVNENAETFRVTARMSTASEYFAAVRKEVATNGVAVSLRGNDFLPYASWFDGYWSGFYGSRPNLKTKIREIESSMRSADHALVLLVASGIQPTPRLTKDIALWLTEFAMGCTMHAQPRTECKELSRDAGAVGDMENVVAAVRKSLAIARRTIALLAHHDAVTGTSTSDVVASYESMSEWAADSARAVSSLAMGLVVSAGSPAQLKEAPLKRIELATVASSRRVPVESAVSPFFADLKLPLKEALCESVVLQNDLAWSRAEIVRLPIAVAALSTHVTVLSSDGEVVVSQIMPKVDASGVDITVIGSHLVFRARMPALGVSIYTLCVDSVNTPPNGSRGGAVPAKVSIFTSDTSMSVIGLMPSLYSLAVHTTDAFYRTPFSDRGVGGGGVTVRFDRQGLPASIKEGTRPATNLSFSLVRYRADFVGLRHGAYKMRMDFGIAPAIGFGGGVLVSVVGLPLLLVLLSRVSRIGMPVVRQRMHPTTFNMLAMGNMGAGICTGAWLATYVAHFDTLGAHCVSFAAGCVVGLWPLLLSRWLDITRRLVLILAFVFYATLALPVSKFVLQDYMAGTISGGPVLGIVTVEGPVLSEVVSVLNGGICVVSSMPQDGLPLTLFGGAAADGDKDTNAHLYQTIAVDVRHIASESNSDTALRIDSSVRNHGSFITDRGGLGVGVVRRHTEMLRQLPGNFYPATNLLGITGAAADSGGPAAQHNDAVFLLTRRSIGASSLRSGRLEAVLHRRSRVDDGAGLMEGTNDVQPIDTSFRLVVIPRRDAQAGARALEVSREALAHNFPPSAYRWAPTVPLGRSGWHGALRHAWIAPLHGMPAMPRDVHVQHMSLVADDVPGARSSSPEKVVVRLQRLLSARSVDRPPYLPNPFDANPSGDELLSGLAENSIVPALRARGHTLLNFLGTRDATEDDAAAMSRDARWLTFSASFDRLPTPGDSVEVEVPFTGSTEKGEFAGIAGLVRADQHKSELDVNDGSAGVGAGAFRWLFLAALAALLLFVARRVRSASQKPHLR